MVLGGVVLLLLVAVAVVAKRVCGAKRHSGSVTYRANNTRTVRDDDKAGPGASSATAAPDTVSHDSKEDYI